MEWLADEKEEYQEYLFLGNEPLVYPQPKDVYPGRSASHSQDQAVKEKWDVQ